MSASCAEELLHHDDHIAIMVMAHYNEAFQHQEPVLSTELKQGSRVPTHTFEFRTQVIKNVTRGE